MRRLANMTRPLYTNRCLHFRPAANTDAIKYEQSWKERINI